VCSTGIGGPSSAIVIEELIKVGADTFIRVGSSGGRQPDIPMRKKINEQISKGVTVMLQTKSITLENIQVVLDLPDPSQVVLITDDIEPSLLIKGHLSRMVMMAIDAGLQPMHAFAAATTYPARYMKQRKLGAIAPGYADL
jgi:adenine deaminase